MFSINSSNYKNKYRSKYAFLLLFVVLFLLFLAVFPIQILSAVTPQTSIEEHVATMSAEEKVVLETLFTISLQLEELKLQQIQITNDIGIVNPQIQGLQQQITKKQQELDKQLEILKIIMANYQRRGATSYLDVLLGAESLSDFLRSINVLKDLSRNSANLLTNLTRAQKELLAQQTTLTDKENQLQASLQALNENLSHSEQLKQEQTEYLASLQTEIDYYQTRLVTLEEDWTKCIELFSEFLDDITRIIESEHFVLENEYLSFDFFRMQVKLQEGSFNSILKNHSKFPDTVFRFQDDYAVVEFPTRNLVLTGDFVLVGESAIEFQASSGTFHQLPLEQAALDQLFSQGPLMIDFSTFTDSFVLEFSISKVEIKGNQLVFSIKF